MSKTKYENIIGFLHEKGKEMKGQPGGVYYATDHNGNVYHVGPEEENNVISLIATGKIVKDPETGEFRPKVNFKVPVSQTDNFRWAYNISPIYS